MNNKLRFDKININKFNSSFINKLELKEIDTIFKFYIPSQNAQVKSIWAPNLTPYLNKDKLKEFCNIYNKFNIYKKDVLVPIFFILYQNKSYECVLRPLNLFFLFKTLCGLDKVFKVNNKFYYITYEELYWILLLKNNFDNNNLKYLFKVVVNRLKDFNIKIIKK